MWSIFEDLVAKKLRWKQFVGWTFDLKVIAFKIQNFKQKNM